MNGNLKLSIGKLVSVSATFFIDGERKVEHIQGLLVDVKDNDILINQHIPFCNFFVENADFTTFKRTINISNIENGINQI